MAKFIEYNLCTIVKHGKEKTEEILTAVTMEWNEANENIAQQEAYNGEYTVVDYDNIKLDR